MSVRYSITPIFTTIICVLFVACHDDRDWQTIETKTFTIQAPPEWKLSEDVGYDSYVGTISGPQGTLYFDQGLFAFAGLDKITENDNTLYFERTSIDGVPAIIHKEKLQYASTYKIVLTAYIDAGDQVHLNRLYAYDPSGAATEKVLIGIMKSHRFK
jgi:hypothetical protein